jgi:hydrogenase nickel incorporation protein HypA/HybF
MFAVHELALTESVVQAITERLGDRHVVRVRLEIGRLVAVLPDAMRFCFDVCTKDTPLDGAVLEIDELPARGRCRACGAEPTFDSVIALCGCGSADVELLAGDELRIKEVEVA